MSKRAPGQMRGEDVKSRWRYTLEVERRKQHFAIPSTLVHFVLAVLVSATASSLPAHLPLSAAWTGGYTAVLSS